MAATLYDELGETRLREIVDAFVDKVFADRMIGFFFRTADRQRLKEMEFQLTAAFLGADVKYEGRDLREAHAPHPIMGGQFARRQQILRETLARFDVPGHIQDAWLAHTESLRSQITRDAGSDCDPMAARERALAGSSRRSRGSADRDGRRR
jgi:hemoglobin